jgi:hypothetical protein
MVGDAAKDITQVCASSPALGRPRSIGSEGIGICTMLSQTRQENAGRMCRMILKWPGM